jgi:hypothetical protein
MVRAPEAYAPLWGAMHCEGIDSGRVGTWHECCEGYPENFLIRSTPWH